MILLVLAQIPQGCGQQICIGVKTLCDNQKGINDVLGDGQLEESEDPNNKMCI